MYAEETSKPHIVVSRVMFLAVGFVALFFAFSAWALTIATGPGEVVKTAAEAAPACSSSSPRPASAPASPTSCTSSS